MGEGQATDSKRCSQTQNSNISSAQGGPGWNGSWSVAGFAVVPPSARKCYCSFLIVLFRGLDAGPRASQCSLTFPKPWVWDRRMTRLPTQWRGPQAPNRKVSHNLWVNGADVLLNFQTLNSPQKLCKTADFITDPATPPSLSSQWHERRGHLGR